MACTLSTSHQQLNTFNQCQRIRNRVCLNVKPCFQQKPFAGARQFCGSAKFIWASIHQHQSVCLRSAAAIVLVSVLKHKHTLLKCVVRIVLFCMNEVFRVRKLVTLWLCCCLVICFSMQQKGNISVWCLLKKICDVSWCFPYRRNSQAMYVFVL